MARRRCPWPFAVLLQLVSEVAVRIISRLTGFEQQQIRTAVDLWLCRRIRDDFSKITSSSAAPSSELCHHDVNGRN
jgi:hypothetical protein